VQFVLTESLDELPTVAAPFVRSVTSGLGRTRGAERTAGKLARNWRSPRSFCRRSFCDSRLAEPAAALAELATALTAPALTTFLKSNRRDHQGCAGISPPPADQGVCEETDYERFCKRMHPKQQPQQ
jgi:hypothetical protein